MGAVTAKVSAKLTAVYGGRPVKAVIHALLAVGLAGGGATTGVILSQTTVPAPNAVDYSMTRPSSPAALKAAGIVDVARYLLGSPSKDLTASEAAGLHAAGIGIVVNPEGTGTEALGGADAGKTIGAQARAQAKAIGVPAGTPLYYSVDFDATASQMPTILAFLDAANSATYPARPYGSYAVCQAWASYCWQTYAWSSGKLSPHAVLYQYSNNHTLAGATVDYDRVIDPAHLGAWKPAAAKPAVVKPATRTSNTLPAGYHLTPGQALAKGTYRLAVQRDGNVVLYHGKKVLWQTRTNKRKTTSFAMQRDGNLVLYASKKALWATHTNGKHGDRLIMQSDGNLVLYAGSKPLWWTHTAGR